MKKFASVILSLIIINLTTFPQCPDSLYITSQSQIDSFQFNYPGCTYIEGDVIITGKIGINNLSGLSSLTSIGGDFIVGGTASLFSTSIKNFEGMDNLVNIGGNLEIRHNNYLSSLEGLTSLNFIGGNTYIYSNSLDSLTGLNSLHSIGNLWISSNDDLLNLKGLGTIKEISGYLRIEHNDGLRSLKGLDSLKSIGGLGLYIAENENLLTLEGLNNLERVENKLSIGKTLFGSYYGNPSLIDLDGLLGLKYIGGVIYIAYNDSLQNINGLRNLDTINGIRITVMDNYQLKSLSGLDSVAMPNLEEVWIVDNTLLETCHGPLICSFLADTNSISSIEANSAGCNSAEEVLDSCEAHSKYNDWHSINYNLMIFPNPVRQDLNISVEGFTIDEIVIYTLTGQQVFTIRHEGKSIDVSSLQPGMYIIEVAVEYRKIRQKLLVQR